MSSWLDHVDRSVVAVSAVVIGGLLNGSWNLATNPSAPRALTATAGSWEWENVWFIFTLCHVSLNVGLVYGMVGVTTLHQVYAEASLRDLALMATFSVFWGFGTIGFGQAIKILGMALGTSLVMGVILVLGTVLPAVLHHEDMTLSRAIFTGVGCAVGLLGFALSAKAGKMREKYQKYAERPWVQDVVDTYRRTEDGSRNPTPSTHPHHNAHETPNRRFGPKGVMESSCEPEDETSPSQLNNPLRGSHTGQAVVESTAYDDNARVDAFTTINPYYQRQLQAQADQQGVGAGMGPPVPLNLSSLFDSAPAQSTPEQADRASASGSSLEDVPMHGPSQTAPGSSRFQLYPSNTPLPEQKSYGRFVPALESSPRRPKFFEYAGQSTLAPGQQFPYHNGASPYSRPYNARGDEGAMSFMRGLALSVVGGVLSSMLQFAFVFGDNLRKIGERDHGLSSWEAAMPIWLLAFTLGGIGNLGWSIYKLSTRYTWRCFRYATAGETLHCFLICCVMAACYVCHIHLYGYSVAFLGDGEVGAAFAWPLLISTTVATGQVWSVILGEWSDISHRPWYINLFSMLCTIAAVPILAYAQSL